MTETMTIREALEKVAAGATGPLSAEEIVGQALSYPLRLKGATPRASVQAALYTEAKKGRLFTKAGRGRFAPLNGAA